MENKKLWAILTRNAQKWLVQDVLSLVFEYARTRFDPWDLTCFGTLELTLQRGFDVEDWIYYPGHWVHYRDNEETGRSLLEVYNIPTGQCLASLSFNKRFRDLWVCNQTLILNNELPGVDRYMLPDLIYVDHYQPPESSNILGITFDQIAMVSITKGSIGTFVLIDFVAKTVVWRDDSLIVQYDAYSFFGQNKVMTWNDGTAQLWEITTANLHLARTLQFARPHRFLYLDPDRIVVKGRLRQLKIWNLTTTQCLPKVRFHNKNLRFGPQINPDWFLTFGDRELHIRQTTTGKSVRTMQFEHQILSAEVGKEHFAVVLANASVRFFSTPSYAGPSVSRSKNCEKNDQAQGRVARFFESEGR
jgi:hypothetical protein